LNEPIWYRVSGGLALTQIATKQANSE
jgi:hypothetical protein